MSDPTDLLDNGGAEKDDNLIDLSESSVMSSSLLDFQVDNAEVYAHADSPIIEGAMEEQSHQQLDLIDNFDANEEDIKFTELRDTNEDDESIEIHGGVELPDLPDLPDLSANKLGTPAASPDGNTPNQVSTMLPDITDISGVDANNDLDYEQAKLSDYVTPAVTNPTEPETTKTTKDDDKDEQIRILREIIQSAGDFLVDQVPNSTFSIPESFDETSASEVVTQFSSLIAQISASKTASTVATVVKLEQPAWLDEESQQKAAAVNFPEGSDWEESNEYQPPPDYGLESPVISHLLNTWTTDTTKIDFLRSWVRSLYMPSYESRNYPPGLQITNLSGVLRDGFMVLLVPLIRSLSKPPLVVHVKRHLASQDRLLPTARSTSADSEHSPTDPFANDVLYDIRIKRLDITLSADSGLHNSTVEGYMSDHVAARQFYQSNQGSAKFRVDSQYYSPLSEINSALPAIEEKTKRRVFDHAPKEDLEEMMKPHHTPGPRHKSFDREYPGYSSFSRGVDAADRGPRSVSFSMPHAPPVPQATILESIYSWWGAAPAPTPTPVTPAVVVKEPVAQTPISEKSATSEVARSESPYISLADAVASAPHKAEKTEKSDSARASPAVTPVNKIAERLQKIRDQKQQQQQV